MSEGLRSKGGSSDLESLRIAFWGKDIAWHYSSLVREFTARGVHAQRFGPDVGFRRYRGLPKTRARMALDLMYRVSAKSELVLRLPGGGRYSAVFSFPMHLTHRLISAIESWLDVLFLLRKFDVLVFGFGASATDTAFELRLYRLCRRKIYFVFHGSDARPPYIDEVRAPIGAEIDWEGLRSQTDRIYARVKRVERFADEILAYPAISHFFTRPIIDWFAIGKPLIIPAAIATAHQPDRGQPDPRGESGGRPFRVGHAPSRPSVKGTTLLLEEIEWLKRDGWNIEIVMTVGFVSQTQVLELLATCDVVVDQLWADAPGGTLAAEAVRLGFSVIVGLLEKEFVENFYPERRQAMIFADGEEVGSALQKILEREAAGLPWRPTGQLRDQAAVVDEYLKIFSGHRTDDWMFSPKEIDVVFGFGPRPHLRSIAGGYMARFGVEALRLDHRPQLRTRMCQFAERHIECASVSEAAVRNAARYGGLADSS